MSNKFPKVPKKDDNKNAQKVQTSASNVPELICKSYADGCLVLGCIQEVLSDELVVTLPGIGNFGYIKFSHISSTYTNYLLENNNNKELIQLSDMYKVGELLKCKVLKYEKDRLHLTIEPHEINSSISARDLEIDMIISGAVKSKEDHGFNIDLGIANLIAFYKNPSEDHQLFIGKCCNFRITSKTSERMVNVIACSGNEFSEIRHKTSFDAYLPGTKITCAVDKVCSNGLKLNIFNLVGYIHINHIDGVNQNKKKLKEKYQHSQKLLGTIIYLNPYSKILYLSLLPHLMDSEHESKVCAMQKSGLVGSVVDCNIVNYSFKGLYVDFNISKGVKIIGFIPKKDLIEQNAANGAASENGKENDEKKPKANKKSLKNYDKNELMAMYPLKQAIKARVIKVNQIEDICLLSAKKSALTENYLNYDSLSLGEVVKGKVKEFNASNGGLIVQLSDYVNGFIPKIHTSDIPLNDPLSKMPIGKEVKCKVIQLDVGEKKLILSAKKSLLKAKTSDVVEIDSSLKIEQRVTGIVVAIKEYGLIIGFLNDVKALLPLADIQTVMNTGSQQIVNKDNLKNLFYLGQVVKCKLSDINIARQLLKVSINLAPSKKNEDNDADEKKKVKQNGSKKDTAPTLDLRVGHLFGSDKKFLIDSVNVAKGFVKLKLDVNEYGLLYKYHLSDMDELNEEIFRKLKKGDAFDFGLDLMVIREKNQKNKLKCHYLTGKRTLIDYFHSKKAEAEIKEGDLESEYATGWICKLNANGGLLIELAKRESEANDSNKVAFCSQKKLNASQKGLYKIGKSVYVDKLMPNAKDLKNNVCTIKLSEELSGKNNAKEIKYKYDYLKAYLSLNRSQMAKVSNEDFAKKPIDVKVTSVDTSDNTIYCKLNDEVVCYGQVEMSVPIAVGSVMRALIIDYDWLRGMYCVSFDEPHFKNITHKLNTDNSFLKVNQVIKGELLFFNKYYGIVLLKQHAMGKLAYLPLFNQDKTQSKLEEDYKKLNKLTDNNLNNTKFKYNYFTIGTSLKCDIKFVDDVIFGVQEGKLKSKGEASDEPKKIVDEKEAKKLALKRKLRQEDKTKDTIEVLGSGAGESLSSQIGSGMEFPWEISSFDQFYELINKDKAKESEEKEKENEEPLKKKKKGQVGSMVDDKLIVEMEEKLCDINRDAETSDDFEKLIVSNPNSSLIWIKYIVFFLQSVETEKARKVAERALKAISYREEDEKLNVWVAYMNLENMYGTPDSLEEVFNRATQNCDALKVYQHLAEIYSRSQKFDDARNVYNKMAKKFNKTPEVWLKYAIFEYKNSNSEAARKLLVKSLNSLEKKDHIDIINKFAQLEFKYGDIERAKTMYDSLLFTYQNRTDLWSVYIDMLIKYNRKNDARNVFNRIVQLNLTPKRMKFIFKKYIDFEKAHGNEASIENVKQMALKYVENKHEAMKMALPQNDSMMDIENDQDDEKMNIDDSRSLEKTLIKNLKI